MFNQAFTEALKVPEVCINDLSHIDVNTLDCLGNTEMQLADVTVALVSTEKISILLSSDL